MKVLSIPLDEVSSHNTLGSKSPGDVHIPVERAVFLVVPWNVDGYQFKVEVYNGEKYLGCYYTKTKPGSMTTFQQIDVNVDK